MKIGSLPAGKVVFFNRDDPTQVRRVTDNTWQSLATAVFANCTITLAQVGTTGHYYADIPTGLDTTLTWDYEWFPTSATAFDDPDRRMFTFEPGSSSSGVLADFIVDGTLSMQDVLKHLYAEALGPASGPSQSVPRVYTIRDQSGTLLKTITVTTSGERIVS